MSRRISHWTPRYVKSRIRIWNFHRKHGGPHLALGAIDFLSHWLRPTDSMLEYGSGYSTGWFARRVGKLVSVENDPHWFEIVKTDLAKNKLLSVDLRLLKDGPQVEGAAAGAGTDYLGPLQEFPANSFDVVLNDGWARAQVGNRVELVRPGGLFIWDDFNEMNQAIQEFMTRVALWRKLVFDDGIHITGIFVRPVQ